MNKNICRLISKRFQLDAMEFQRPSWIVLLIILIALVAMGNNNQNTEPSLIPCENGWFFFNNMCYKVFDKIKGVTWKEAGVSCSANYGTLVTIQSKELQDFLTTFLLLDAKSNVWIGLNDLEEESKFIWNDGSLVNYTNWEPGEPSGSKYRKEDCAQMKYITTAKRGMWNDFSCDTVSPYICQTKKSEQSLNLDPRFCTDENDGALSYLNSCYHTIDEEMTWDDAENYCQTVLKGYLLSIVDSQTNTFLNYALSKFNKEFWIGIKIRESTTYQKWTSGRLVKFKNWKNSHWSYINGTCAFVMKEKTWSSASCLQKLPFACEVPKEKLPALQIAPDGWKCPQLSEDWIDLGGYNCYIYETRKPQKWLNANFICSKKGGNLASIHSVAETHAIHSYLINNQVGEHEAIYIGLHRSWSNNTVFEWADGTKLDYKNWKVGEPSQDTEKCGEVLTDDMTWNDVSCEDSKGYICSGKKEPPAEVKETTFKDHQHLVNTDCSGTISSNFLLAVLLVGFALITSFMFYIFKDHCRKVNNKRWNCFTSRERRGSSEFIER